MEGDLAGRRVNGRAERFSDQADQEGQQQNHVIGGEKPRGSTDRVRADAAEPSLPGGRQEDDEAADDEEHVDQLAEGGVLQLYPAVGAGSGRQQVEDHDPENGQGPVSVKDRDDRNSPALPVGLARIVEDGHRRAVSAIDPGMARIVFT